MNERALALVFTWFLATAAMAAEPIAYVAPDLLHSLPWVSICVAGMIAIWGGLTQTSLRKKTDFFTGVRDAFVASGAGFVMFMIAAAFGFNIWLTSASIYLAGWLGARFLSVAGERLLNFIRGIRFGDGP